MRRSFVKAIASNLSPLPLWMMRFTPGQETMVLVEQAISVIAHLLLAK